MVQLKEKEEQLEENKKANEVGGYFKHFLPIYIIVPLQELRANLNVEKAQTVQAIHGIDGLKSELVISHKTISAFQMTFW
jgi:hypothetical protein